VRILQLITQNQLRGAEVFAAQLSDGLADRGHAVVLAAVCGTEEALITGPNVRQVALRGALDGRLPISPRACRNLRRLVHECRPDIVQANGSETLKYAVLLRARYPSPPVVYRNISIMSMWSSSGTKRRLVAAALRHMSHVVAVTAVGAEDLVENFGVPPTRLSVIPIGVTVPPPVTDDEREAARQRVRARFGLPPRCPLVVHVGSFALEKNHGDLVQAFRLVLRTLPDARLLLVGEGPLRAHVEAMVASAGVDASTVFAGSLPDAARVIAAADVLVLPSLREGLPGVVLEASAAGIPTVAYNVGGLGEIVEDEASGVLVKERDVPELSEALCRVLTHPGFAARLGEAARVRMAAGFDLDTAVKRFEELYRSLIAEGAAAR
jgi:glycosyltransferase involved in cell wall biosynthesis